MKRRTWLLAVLCGICLMVKGVGAQTALKEDFEGERPKLPVLWATNAKEWKVNFSGITDERSFSGKQSFKLDLTINGGNWHYWWLPVRIPFKAPMKVKLFNQQHRASFGFGYAVPEAGTQGNVEIGHMLKRHENGWEEWEADASSYVGTSELAYIQGLALYIFALPGGFKDTRVVVCTDDFEVIGVDEETTGAWQQQLEEGLIKIRERNRQQQVQRSKRLLQRSEQVERLLRQPRKEEVPSKSWLKDFDERLGGWCLSQWGQVLHDVRALQADMADGAAAGRLDKTLPLMELAAQSRLALPAYAKAHGEKPYLVHIVSPIQNLRILPDSFPVAGVIGTELKVSASRGEFEPASFAITANEDLKKVDVKVSPLRHSSLVTRHSPLVDVRVVKVWWQAGFGISDVHNPTLTPELLLKDDSFVYVYPDPKKHRNILKDPKEPKDALTLQPVDILKGTTKQFWLTVKVPEKAASGIYKGSVEIAPSNAPPMKLSLGVEVYPFDWRNR